MTNGVTLTELAEAQSRDEEVNQLKNGYRPLNTKKFKVKTINNVKVAEQMGKPGYSLIIPRSLVENCLEWAHSWTHQGINAMIRRLTTSFFLPNCTENVKKFVKRFVICRKKPGRKPNQPFRSNKHQPNTRGPAATSICAVLCLYLKIITDIFWSWSIILPDGRN